MRTIDTIGCRAVLTASVVLHSGCIYECDGKTVISTSTKACSDEDGADVKPAEEDPADPRSSAAIPGMVTCCSENYGDYVAGYGFFGFSYNCQTDPVLWGFELMEDPIGSSEFWSKEAGLTIAATHSMLLDLSSDFRSIGADFEIKNIVGGYPSSAVPGPDALYRAEDGHQVIGMLSTILDEDLETPAVVKCYNDGCVNYECDIVVSTTGDTASTEHYTLNYTLSDTAGPGVYSLRTVLAHELGHALGLNHPASVFASPTIMYNLTILKSDDGSLDYTGLPTADADALLFIYGKR